MGTEPFPGVQSGRGVTLTPHPLLVTRSKNRVKLYLYCPLGPSWPVKRVKPTNLQTDNVLDDKISSVPLAEVKDAFEIGYDQTLAAIYLLTILNQLLTPFDVKAGSFETPNNKSKTGEDGI
jgi:hypothetical protein